MNYFERQRWKEWFAALDAEMTANFGPWFRLFLMRK